MAGALNSISSPGFSVENKNPVKLSAWLPGLGHTPLPSSSMLAERPESKAHPALLLWTVTAFPLDMGEASDLLCSVMGKKGLAPGVISGNDLLWWAGALKFARNLVAGQAYLPGIRLEAGKIRGRWEPVYSGTQAPELGEGEGGPLPVLEEEDEVSSLPPEPLPLDPGVFWGRPSEKTGKEGATGEVYIPSVSAGLPRQLGKFPFWRGEEDLLEVLEGIYGKASPVGMKVFLGEKIKMEEE